jgi:glutamate dehydrogenase
VKGDAQLALYQATQDLVNGLTLWFLRDGRALGDLSSAIALHRAGLAALRPVLDALLPAGQRSRLAQDERRFAASGVPADLAGEVARLGPLQLAPPIAQIADDMGRPVPDTARIFFEVGERLHIAELAGKANTIKTSDYYDRLAVAQALGQLAAAQAAVTREVLRAGGTAEHWLALQGARLARITASLGELTGEGVLTLSRLLVAAGQLSELAAAAPSASATTARKEDRSRSAPSETRRARRP